MVSTVSGITTDVIATFLKNAPSPMAVTVFPPSSDGITTSPDKSADVAFLDRDIDIDKDIEEVIDNISIAKSSPKKPKKHKHGEYNNVLLTDDELEKLQLEYPDWSDRIERLSSYIASTGKAYKSHYATIRNWAKKDTQQQIVQPRPQQRGSGYNDAILNRVKNVDNW